MARRSSVCRKGLHRFSRENVYINPLDGRRRCRQCLTSARRRYHRANAEKRRAYIRDWKRRNLVPKPLDEGRRLEILAKAREVNRSRIVPGSRVQPLVRWLVDRWGKVQTSRALGVSEKTVRNILHGQSVRPSTAQKIVHVMNYQANQAAIREGRAA